MSRHRHERHPPLKRGMWLLAACCAFFSLTALAAPASPPVLSFGESLSRLWASHPELRQGDALVAASEFGINAAYTGYLPYVQVDMAQDRDGQEDYEARLILPLWSGGLTPASVDSAKAGRDAAQFERDRLRLDLGLRLTDAWFAVVATREQQQLWQQYLAALGQLQGLIERRAAAGASPEADVQNILSRIRQAEAEATLNASLLASARAQYQSLLGGPADAGDWPATAQLLTPAEVQAVPERAAENHPALQLAKTTIAREDADRRSSRARLSPELSLRYVRSFGEQVRRVDPTVQLALQYQSDSGLRAYQEYRAGQERLNGAQAALEAGQREVLATIAVAQAERQAALAQIDYQQEAIRAADEVSASARRQFEAGRKTWIEVLNAQREAHETRMQLLQQRRSLWQANMRLALHGLYWERLLPAGATAPAQGGDAP